MSERHKLLKDCGCGEEDCKETRTKVHEVMSLMLSIATEIGRKEGKAEGVKYLKGFGDALVDEFNEGFEIVVARSQGLLGTAKNMAQEIFNNTGLQGKLEKLDENSKDFPEQAAKLIDEAMKTGMKDISSKALDDMMGDEEKVAQEMDEDDITLH